MHHLNVPGLNNSGPQHWQTLWEELLPKQFNRVQQKNWSAPVKKEWVSELDTTLKDYDEPVVLVAHSLGCVTVAHWANENKSASIAGALLVAPADTERSGHDCFKTFCPIPRIRLPFPSIVVASTNDPYATTGNSAKLAAWWGSKFICIGAKGHINAQSGLDQWEEGLSILSAFTKSI